MLESTHFLLSEPIADAEMFLKFSIQKSLNTDDINIGFKPKGMNIHFFLNSCPAIKSRPMTVLNIEL
jgi:hypothetical protein